MKTRELIDFIRLLKETYPGMKVEDLNLRKCVNLYKKSIHSAQRENSNVSDNEKQKEECDHPYATLITKASYSQCLKCGAILE